MWFGDLVTCRWWGDLWLKESFAEFMGSHVSVEVCGFADGWVNFAATRKVGAYLADAMPTTHPVVADIPDLEAAKTNFDRITYSKGSSALTQLVHYVGLDAFLRGSRRYFAAHAFGSATLADFIAALAEETVRDLTGWVMAWLETAGHDTLDAELTVADGAIERLTLTRRAPREHPADRPHATTVALYRLREGRLELDASLPVVVDADVVEVPDAAGRPAPDAVLVNDRDQTFAAVDLDPASRAVLVAHVGDLDPLARAVAWTSLWTGLRAGRVSAGDFVGAVLGAGERQTGLLASLVAWGQRAVAAYTTDLSLAAVWRDGCRAAALAAAPGSPEQALWAKAYLTASSLATEDVHWVLDGDVPGLVLSVDVTWAAWQSLSAQGTATDADLDAALAADDTAAGRVARLRCWASRPDAAVKAEAWRRAHTVDGESNDAVDALLAGFNALGQSRPRRLSRRRRGRGRGLAGRPPRGPGDPAPRRRRGDPRGPRRPSRAGQGAVVDDRGVLTHNPGSRPIAHETACCASELRVGRGGDRRGGRIEPSDGGTGRLAPWQTPLSTRSRPLSSSSPTPPSA
jgi:aminopeptidase N